MEKVYIRRRPDESIDSGFSGGLILDLFESRLGGNVTSNIPQIVSKFAPPATVLDLLVLATSVYVIDKKSTRISQGDGWTRAFSVSVPVSNVATWEMAEPVLINALEFLTGDKWKFEWRPRDIEESDSSAEPDNVFTHVCLFSGGVDSLIGAIDILETDAQARVVLVAHHDSNLTVGPQETLSDALKANYGAQRVEMLPVSARPGATGIRQIHPLSEDGEKSTRSRSFLFIAAALAAASRTAPGTPVCVPENGLIAINGALTEARLGSCSTRTTHPYFLHLLRTLASVLGIEHPPMNPYQFKTKGDMIKEVSNAELFKRISPGSISCSHPEVPHYLPATEGHRREFGSSYGNCGYCYPCIIRRAAFHAAGLDTVAVSGKYLFDVTSDVALFQEGDRMHDARAVFGSFHDTTLPAITVLATGKIPEDIAVADLVETHIRGRGEVRQLFVDKASSDIKRIAGI